MLKRASHARGAAIKPPIFQASRATIVSAAAHAVALLALLGVFHFASHPAPLRLPGTAEGVRTISYYAPGSLHSSHSPVPVKQAPDTPPTTPATPVMKAPPPPTPASAPVSEAGTGNSAQSGLGQGNLNIALQKVFPYPSIEVPRGTHGDVILNAVIDEHGTISDLTVVSGLSADVNDQVLAIVRNWSYTPATRNGIPVVSEQELRFHYDRS